MKYLCIIKCFIVIYVFWWIFIKYFFTKRKNINGFLKWSVIENVVYKTEFRKLRHNFRKGILKGIYWNVIGLWVGILNEFCVVLLRDFFYYRRKIFFFFLNRGLNKFLHFNFRLRRPESKQPPDLQKLFELKINESS